MDDLRVALLRGINIGRARRVAMADLRDLFADIGYRDARTVLNSGNVVFRAPGATGAAAARLEAALVAHLGVPARVTVLTAGEFETAAVGDPLAGTARDPSRLLLAFLADPADRPKLAPLAEQDWTPEAFAIGDRAAYLWCPDGVIASRLAKALDRALGDAVTTRNQATVAKVLALADEMRGASGA
jgi:uncharacterized protein (DUF1697 family)